MRSCWSRSSPPWERASGPEEAWTWTRALSPPPRSRYVACVPRDASRWRPTARPAPAAGAPRGCSSTAGAPVRVVTCAGPWRITGEWWDAHPWARDEWDVELADGLVCRLARDRIQGHWYLDGVYD